MVLVIDSFCLRALYRIAHRKALNLIAAHWPGKQRRLDAGNAREEAYLPKAVILSLVRLLGTGLVSTLPHV